MTSSSPRDEGQPSGINRLNSMQTEESIPSQGRLGGIDFGTVRIGIATCDPSQNWVTPLETYQVRNERLDGQHFAKLASDEALVGWVIGLPIHCDGKESQKSKEVRAFGAWLSELTELPVEFYDERFTTREARRLLQDADLSSAKKKKRLDRLAAHLILSHFLDYRANRSKLGPGPTLSQNEALDDG